MGAQDIIALDIGNSRCGPGDVVVRVDDKVGCCRRRTGEYVVRCFTQGRSRCRKDGEEIGREREKECEEG